MKLSLSHFRDHHFLATSATSWLRQFINEIYYRYLYSEADFLRAMQHGELVIHYQPIVNIRTGLWLGAEALMRWPAKGKEFKPETTFSILERSNIICNVTRWICQQVMEEYSQSLWACDPFYITVNLSTIDVLDHTFPDFVKALTTRYAFPASHLAFEISERVALEGPLAEIQLNRLRALGHLILLDDFGTGFSNLAYLEQLPVDVIKVDKIFTRRLGESADIILSHILKLVEQLEIDVIVEGVETKRQADRLSMLGAQKAQGWLYSRDLPVHELVRGYFSKHDRTLYTPRQGGLQSSAPNSGEMKGF